MGCITTKNNHHWGWLVVMGFDSCALVCVCIPSWISHFETLTKVHKHLNRVKGNSPSFGLSAVTHSNSSVFQSIYFHRGWDVGSSWGFMLGTLHLPNVFDGRSKSGLNRHCDFSGKQMISKQMVQACLIKLMFPPMLRLQSTLWGAFTLQYTVVRWQQRNY